MFYFIIVIIIINLFKSVRAAKVVSIHVFFVNISRIWTEQPLEMFHSGNPSDNEQKHMTPDEKWNSTTEQLNAVLTITKDFHFYCTPFYAFLMSFSKLRHHRLSF